MRDPYVNMHNVKGNIGPMMQTGERQHMGFPHLTSITQSFNAIMLQSKLHTSKHKIKDSLMWITKHVMPYITIKE